MNNQILNLKLGDLNIYNVLASIAVLKELNIRYFQYKSKI